jgi:hypothetical protein
MSYSIRRELRAPDPLTIACDNCGAEAGEVCRPYCTAEAAHSNDREDQILAMKPALDTRRRPHQTVEAIQRGVAAGWRLVFFKDGTEKRMSCTEVASLGVDPFVNINDLFWED